MPSRGNKLWQDGNSSATLSPDWPANHRVLPEVALSAVKSCLLVLHLENSMVFLYSALAINIITP